MLLDIRSILAAAVAALGIGLVTFGAAAQVYFVHGDEIAAFIGLPRSEVTARAASARKVQQILEGTNAAGAKAPTGVPAGEGAPADPIAAANTDALIQDRFGDASSSGQPGAVAAPTGALAAAPADAEPHAHEAAPSGIGGPFVPVTPPRTAKEPTAEPIGSALTANASIARKPERKKKKVEAGVVPRRVNTVRSQPDTNPFKHWFDR